MNLTRMTNRRLCLILAIFLLPLSAAPLGETDDSSQSAPFDLPQISRPGDLEQLQRREMTEDQAVAVELMPRIDLERELAGQFVRNARELLAMPQLTVQSLNIALILADEATKLAPDDPEVWYIFHSIASLAENAEQMNRATQRLLELEPQDDVILLSVLQRSIERFQTANERAEAYRKALAREKLPATVRSRLAFELAMLERRRGRTDSFAQWLADSITLDRFNASAAALAAGYFRLNVDDDPIGIGELLVHQFKANVTDISSQMLTANHFLDHGAYNAAERMLTLAHSSYESIALVPTPPELIADLALARWGAGRQADALQELQRYQRNLDATYRDFLLLDEPHLTPLERARRTATTPRSVAVVRAALLARRNADDGVDAIEKVLGLYEELIDQVLESARSEDEQLSDEVMSIVLRSWLESAWLAVWLGRDPAVANRFLERVKEIRDISDTAETRIAGWVALRNGDADRAAELLKDLAPRDAAAGLGYANALLAQGQQRSAARELLRVARSVPGSLIGVWAGDQLAELLGSRPPISRNAEKLNQLLNDVPRYLERLPSRPTSAFSARVRPVSRVFKPYDPVIINLEIRNHSDWPLAIDPEGPILPDVALVFDVRVSGVQQPIVIEPMIVSIGRRFRLEPNERLTIPIDLRQTAVGSVINQHALVGTTVTVRAISNFYISPNGMILPGLFGSEHHAPPINVEGRRLSVEQVNRLHAYIRSHPSRDAARELALMMHFFVALSLQNLDQADMQSLIRTLLAIGSTFERFDPVMQSWLLIVLPTRAAALRPFLDAARKSDHRLVKLAMLQFGGHALTESEFRAMLSDEDQSVRRIARILADSPEEIELRRGVDDGDEPSAIEREMQSMQEELTK